MTTFRGFTLIETLTYLGLVTILISGTVTSIYAVSDSSERIRTHAYEVADMLFVTQRIGYVLEHAAALTSVDTEALYVLSDTGEAHGFTFSNGTLYEQSGDRTEALTTVMFDQESGFTASSSPHAIEATFRVMEPGTMPRTYGVTYYLP